MQRIDRRRCVKLSGAGCAGCGVWWPRRHPRLRAGARLCPGHDPALALKFVDFVPVSDQRLQGQAQGRLAQKALGHLAQCRDR